MAHAWGRRRAAAAGQQLPRRYVVLRPPSPPPLPPPLAPHTPQKLTFLRMGDMMIDNWSAFGAFLQRLTCPP